MEPWVFSDGTEVRLGGEVTGDTPTAKRLRMDLEEIRRGEVVTVPVFVHPGGYDPLDLQSPSHVNAWAYRIAHYSGVRVVSAPEFEPLPDPSLPEGEEYVDGRVY